MGPGGPRMDRICYLVPDGSTCEGDPIWNRTIPVPNWSHVNRVDLYQIGSDPHKRSIKLRTFDMAGQTVGAYADWSACRES